MSNDQQRTENTLKGNNEEKTESNKWTKYEANKGNFSVKARQIQLTNKYFYTKLSLS